MESDMMIVPLNATRTSSKVVIGVDDAPENLFMLQSTLKAADYTFFGMRSGQECLALLSRVTPRLILLDIEMPDMDGFETCRRLRTNPALRQVPVAFLTARNSPEDVRVGVAAGGNDFIVKPFDPVKLLERVRYWTGRSLRSESVASFA